MKKSHKATFLAFGAGMSAAAIWPITLVTTSNANYAAAIGLQLTAVGAVFVLCITWLALIYIPRTRPEGIYTTRLDQTLYRLFGKLPYIGGSD